jgi:TPR repeat protein
MLKWARKAADQGAVEALMMLGYIYESGEGGTQDYAEAMKWYRKAAEQGYAWNGRRILQTPSPRLVRRNM